MKTLVLFLALCGVAAGQQQGYFRPAPQPVYTQQGVWVPVQRPFWIGNALLGPVWYYVPQQQPPQLPPPQQ